MRIRIPLVAAVVAAGFLGSVAQADIIPSSFRVANTNLPGFDTVMIFALNDGLAGTTGDQNIGTMSFTITDNTSAGLVLGAYKSGTKFFGDPDGTKTGGTTNGTFSSTNPTPGYNAFPNYPVDTSASGSQGLGQQMYSWIGNGGLNTTQWSMVDQTPIFPTTGATSVALTGYASKVSSLFVTGFWLTPVDASQAGGLTGTGLYANALDGKGALVAVAVVPTGDVVSWDGLIFPGTGLSQTFAGSNGVPEPASLGMLALGGLALLARRRKVA